MEGLYKGNMQEFFDKVAEYVYRKHDMIILLRRSKNKPGRLFIYSNKGYQLRYIDDCPEFEQLVYDSVNELLKYDRDYDEEE